MDKNDRIKKLENLLQTGKITEKEFAALVQKVKDSDRKVTLAPKEPDSINDPLPINVPQKTINWKKPLIIVASVLLSIVILIILFNQMQSQEQSTISENKSENIESVENDSPASSQIPEVNDELPFEDEMEENLEETTTEIEVIKEESMEDVLNLTPSKPIQSNGIHEFKTFESLPSVNKVSYFTKEIIPLKYSINMSSNEKSKFNSYLKEIASIVGIEKRLTHHIARKTFASTVLLYNNVPMEIVSELLGYSNMSITQEYYGKVVYEEG